jgi:hypothetical protein
VNEIIYSWLNVRFDLLFLESIKIKSNEAKLMNSIFFSKKKNSHSFKCQEIEREREL